MMMKGDNVVMWRVEGLVRAHFSFFKVDWLGGLSAGRMEAMPGYYIRMKL
jgi:hypothetical protein